MRKIRKVLTDSLGAMIVPGSTNLIQRQRMKLTLALAVSMFWLGFACQNNATFDDNYDDGIGWIDQAPLEATQEVDGITFKYKLLNDKGEPANRFYRGENFSFHFEMTNKEHPDSLYYWYNLVCQLTPDGYGTVVTNAGDTTEVLRKRLICTDKYVISPFFGEEKHFELTYPTISEGDNYGTLTAGRYSTELAHVFRFDVGEKFDRTCTLSKPISLKLHFIID